MARVLINKWRTYIIRVLLPDGRVYWYGGQHKFAKGELDSTYKGSGSILNRMQAKYGRSCSKLKWLGTYNTQDSVNDAEIDLIDRLKAKHGKFCINLLPGGHFAGKDRVAISKVQKEVQNRPERKEAQRKAMNNFYANGGNEVISKAIRKKFRTNVWWHDPCKSELESLIKSGHGLTECARKLSDKYPDVTGSKIKNVYYEIVKGLNSTIS